MPDADSKELYVTLTKALIMEIGDMFNFVCATKTSKPSEPVMTRLMSNAVKSAFNVFSKKKPVKTS